jgi:NADPH-dependent ferric siderophore reductase
MTDQATTAARPDDAATTTRAPSSGNEGRDRVRRRPPPRLVEVVSVARLAPRLVSVHLAGPNLAGFDVPGPTSHIKIFLPAGGQEAPLLPEVGPDGPRWPEGATPPVVRTYTPRRYDESAGTLEVQFVLHGFGPASDWAEQAKVGDRVGVAGPGGRFSFDPAVRRWWIAGDESAIPAIGTLLDVLPASATAEVHLEVGDAQDEVPLSSPADITVVWHHRRRPDAWGDDLYRAASGATLAEGTRVWVACEAIAVRRIRKHLLVDRQVPVGALVTRGYWRLGEAGHPDHDYGDD